MEQSTVFTRHSLEIRLENSVPIPAGAFGHSFAALEDEYRLFVEEVAPSEVTVPDVQLCITSFRQGSIIAELQALAPLAVIPFIENANSIVEFTSHLRRCIEALLRRNESEARSLNRRTLANLNNIVQPVALDGGAQINFQAKGDRDVHVHFHLDSTRANAVQNVARQFLDPPKEKAKGTHSGVLMYLHQARNDPRSKSGDKAVIEAISPFPVKLVFENHSVKKKVLDVADNLFRLAFLVDVDVQTIGGRPALYKVLDVLEMFDRPSPT